MIFGPSLVSTDLTHHYKDVLNQNLFHTFSIAHEFIHSQNRNVWVKRYWPCKVPKWANEENEEDAFDKAFTRPDDRRLRHLCRIIKQL
jgi:hypothetical protein